MNDLALLFLLVFYAGAVALTARAWGEVGRGRARPAALRDLTGIASGRELVRSFGPAGADGRFAVTAAAVAGHRRRGGVILSDLQTHLLFLLALGLALLAAEPAASAAVLAAASLDAALIVATAARLALAAPEAVAPRSR